MLAELKYHIDYAIRNVRFSQSLVMFEIDTFSLVLKIISAYNFLWSISKKNRNLSGK